MNPTSLKPFGLGVTSQSNPESGRHVPAFYKFCSNVGAELSRDYAVEFTAFTIIAGISAWPIFSCIMAIGHMLRVS
jgi:hypothetical protein